VKLISISDIHILSEEDPYYAILLDLISKQIQAGDYLILAGDIFDFLLGRSGDIRRRYKKFFDHLESIGNLGAQIHYIEGNHDFHLKQIFAGLPNCHVHESEVTLTLAGKNFYIAHGDLIDKNDVGYLRLRKVLRSSLTGAIANFLPEMVLQTIGAKSSSLSQLSRKNRSVDSRKSSMEYMRKIFRQFVKDKITSGYDFVILGHCHDADELSFQVGDRTGHYMNVGYPKEHRNYIRWEDGQSKFSRVTLSLPSG
jgi:UDP-2,3-diacylglucosamine hydrolase